MRAASRPWPGDTRESVCSCPAERALLPEAVRFASCYTGAIHLYQALAEGLSGASMDARMERLRNRVAVSEAVARLAAPYLAGGAETVR